MIILVYTKFNSKNITDSLGKSEYSYYFVLRKFLPVLREIAEVVILKNPSEEISKHVLDAKNKGIKCIFLSFTAPHNLILDLPCLTIPVFAWEYDTIPNESWGNNEKNNWVNVLKTAGQAITHSEHSAKAIWKELGRDFPILICPAPIEGHHIFSLSDLKEREVLKNYTLKLDNKIIESDGVQHSPLENAKGFAKRIELTHVLLQMWAHEVLEDQLPRWLYRCLRNIYLFSGTAVAKSVRTIQNALRPGPIPPVGPKQNGSSQKVYSGVIYTSILNISDKRKNYMDMVAAFCFALQEHPNATLIIKTPIMEDIYFFKQKVTNFLRSLPPFKCKVVVMGNYLNSQAYQDLMRSTTFYVNTSYGEGQCLPLMEFMSAGIPAIAPFATALKDYINGSNAFMVKTAAVPTCWQHDERIAIRTVHHRPDWYSLVDAYRASFQLALTNEAAYRQMALQAAQSLQNHASFEKTKNKMQQFLNTQLNR